MNKIVVTDGSMLEKFYKDWSLTFEGVVEEEIPLYLDFVREHAGLNDEDCYLVSGKLMNEHYGLTGNNCYPNDLNILVVMLKSIGNVIDIAVPRFQIGGRWFTDIVDNNARREEA